MIICKFKVYLNVMGKVKNDYSQSQRCGMQSSSSLSVVCSSKEFPFWGREKLSFEIVSFNHSKGVLLLLRVALCICDCFKCVNVWGD